MNDPLAEGTDIGGFEPNWLSLTASFKMNVL